MNFIIKIIQTIIELWLNRKPREVTIAEQAAKTNDKAARITSAELEAVVNNPTDVIEELEKGKF